MIALLPWKRSRELGAIKANLGVSMRGVVMMSSGRFVGTSLSGLSRWGMTLICCTTICAVALPLRADEAPVDSASRSREVFSPIQEKPLTLETWPVWRDVLLRAWFMDDLDQRIERPFHFKMREFINKISSRSGEPEGLTNDPIAWLVLTGAHLFDASEASQWTGHADALIKAEAAARKGLALGNPQGVSAWSLASVLIERASEQSEPQLTLQAVHQLDEARELLIQVEQINSEANVDLLRARIETLRGNLEHARELLTSALRKHPEDPKTIVDYLMNDLEMNRGQPNRSQVTKPYADRFSKNGLIQALHALALYLDGRYPEAYKAYESARGLDPMVVQFLGEQTIHSIEEGRSITPKIAEAIGFMKSGQRHLAVKNLREAVVEDPKNPIAARFLAMALPSQVDRFNPTSDMNANVVAEVEKLRQQFPDDPQIKAALAIILHDAGRSIESARLLDQMDLSARDLQKLLPASTVMTIREQAEVEWRVWVAKLAGISILAAAVTSIVLMFSAGLILAICIPRVPTLIDGNLLARSRRDVWLERFYLVALGLGLLGFYLSIPVVMLGLLAVTLAMFFALLVIRVIHFGVLHRGLWATWGVVRCALIGPSHDVLGIEATPETHPRLFETLRTVADQLETRPVDAVFLTPSSSISVHEEGMGPFGLLGQRKRVLNLGISTLPLLTREEFNSILAHEYGHFSHKDTFYSRFLFQVSASLATSLAVMGAAGGILTYVNPFYWFWWLYLRAYTLLCTGFSRSREFLADRRAAAAFGKNCFVSGLTKASVDGSLFETTIYPRTFQLLMQNQAFVNAFDDFRKLREDTEVVESRERILAEAQGKKPRWFDTHPTYSERIAAIDGFPDSPVNVNAEPALHLLSEPEQVEAELTKLLTQRMRQVYFEG